MKNNYKFGLVIGRFQPPCLHHFEFLKEAINSGIKELLIGIGESKNLDFRNFLNGLEVKKLLIPNLDKLNFPYKLVIIPDINNPPKYASYVKTLFKEINEDNTCLFTENDYTSDCFTNYGHNFKVVKPTILPNRATNVRQMMVDNNLDWQKLVPKNVVQFVNKKNISL
jgi:nicotinamide mononucleotide adenylyltransferase